MTTGAVIVDASALMDLHSRVDKLELVGEDTHMRMMRVETWVQDKAKEGIQEATRERLFNEDVALNVLQRLREERFVVLPKWAMDEIDALLAGHHR